MGRAAGWGSAQRPSVPGSCFPSASISSLFIHIFVHWFIHSFPSCLLSSPNQANARESFSQLPGSNENSREIYRHWGEYLGSEGSQGSPVWGGWCHRVSKGLQARVGRGLGVRRASWRREAGSPMCPREKPFGPTAMRTLKG